MKRRFRLWDWRSSDHLFVLDNRHARRHAVTAGLEIIGSPGILLTAKEHGFLDAVQPVVDRLQALRFRLDISVRRKVLALANEER